MAKSNACYFSHDSNALTDIKISVMRSEYGLEGYGLFWAIIEKLRNEETYMLPLEKNTYRAIKIETGTNIDVESFVKDCINEFKETEKGNGLFNTDGHNFWSESLLNRMKKMDEISAKRKAAGRSGANKRWENKQEDNKDTLKKRKIKSFSTKNAIANKSNSKSIANAIKNYSKCYKSDNKVIAKNSKIKSKSKSKIKIKLKDMKSIYPSNHNEGEKTKLETEMDENKKMEFNNMISNCELHLLNPGLAIEIEGILKEMYLKPDTREKIQKINSMKLRYALTNFAIANTKTKIQIPKAYFKKCILSALEQTELSQQYDVDTIYEIMEE